MKTRSLLFFALALVLSLCLVLAACGDKDGKENKLTAESGITVDGRFDSGSALKAEHHAIDSEQGKAAMAAIDKPYDSAKVAVFDIALTKDGEKVQPNGKVKITMVKPFESDAYVTYHIKGDNTVEELSTAAHGNKIYFETTGFSYFVVAGVVQADAQHIHSYVEQVSDRNMVDRATCQRKAVYRLVCSICGSLGRETFEYGELAPHNLREEKGFDPWCEKDGLTHGKRCINPGCTYTEQKPIPAIGHDMQDVAAKEPTCTEIGWKAYKRCAHYCGKTEGYEQIEKTGHNLSVRVARVEPTCEKWGSEEYKKCSNKGCDYHTDYNGLPALGTRKGTIPAPQPAPRTGIGEVITPASAKVAIIRQRWINTSKRLSDTTSNTMRQNKRTACPAGKRTTNVSARGANIIQRWKSPPTASIVTFATYAPRATNLTPFATRARATISISVTGRKPVRKTRP